MGIANLKSRLTSNESMNKIKDAMTKKTSYQDDRYWKFEVDQKTGNGSATIRFMPEPEGEDMAFIKYYEHAFKNGATNQWYIERSLTSLGQNDPVSEHNSKLYNSGDEQLKKIASARKRKLVYVSNILVIDDKVNPSNNGKVMLFKYGASIFEMLQGAINPQFEGDESFNPFCPWTGANFNLRAYNNQGGLRQYDRSKFESVSAIGSDSKIEEIYSQLHSLVAENAPDKYKSYEQLKKRFYAVIGESEPTSNDDTVEKPTTPIKTAVKSDVDVPNDYQSLLDD